MKTIYLFLICLVTLNACTSEKKTGAAEPVYDRVIKTGVLRCGYASWDPILIIDPKTGQISGIAHDVIEEAAKILSLKVEWIEESGWGEYITSLKTNRYDVFCAGPTPNSERARELLFTKPFVFTRLALYTQANTEKFDHNQKLLNNPKTTMAVLDGTTSLKILREEFPKATQISYPESVPFSHVLVETGERKADVTLQAVFAGNIYQRNNPNKLKIIPGFENFRVLRNVYMVNNNEFKLREMLSEAIDELNVAGKLDHIVDRYEDIDGTFLRVPPAHQ